MSPLGSEEYVRVSEIMKALNSQRHASIRQWNKFFLSNEHARSAVTTPYVEVEAGPTDGPVGLQLATRNNSSDFVRDFMAPAGSITAATNLVDEFCGGANPEKLRLQNNSGLLAKTAFFDERHFEGGKSKLREERRAMNPDQLYSALRDAVSIPCKVTSHLPS
jgi:hypothetical protein